MQCLLFGLCAGYVSGCFVAVAVVFELGKKNLGGLYQAWVCVHLAPLFVVEITEADVVGDPQKGGREVSERLGPLAKSGLGGASLEMCGRAMMCPTFLVWVREIGQRGL